MAFIRCRLTGCFPIAVGIYLVFMAVLGYQLAHAQAFDAQAFDAQNTEMRSPEEQRAVTAALDRLMAEQDWYLAEKVAPKTRAGRRCASSGRARATC